MLTGRLVRTLEASGWDPVDLNGAVGGPFTAPGQGGDGGDAEDDAAPGHGRSPKQPGARERREAEARLAAARDALAEAEDAAADLRRRAQRLAVRRDGVAASIEDPRSGWRRCAGSTPTSRRRRPIWTGRPGRRTTPSPGRRRRWTTPQRTAQPSETEPARARAA